jgi:hypothetical protein
VSTRQGPLVGCAGAAKVELAPGSILESATSSKRSSGASGRLQPPGPQVPTPRLDRRRDNYAAILQNRTNICVLKGIPQRTQRTFVEIASVRVDISLRTRIYADAISTDESL